jgi:CheY-like chemotaxis protein
MVRLVSFHVDAALLEGLLSTSSRRVTCHEAVDAAALIARAAAGAPDLVVVAGDAARAADTVEALVDESAFLATPIVAWRIRGGLADTSRLVALGVRVVAGEEDSLRVACEEALDAREGRTMRVDPPTEFRVIKSTQLDLHGRRVVVADDDPAITWFFSDLLRAEGCDVREAEDGEAALDVARRTAPDLVVSDIRMPRMDGARLCRALRSDPILADVPVVLLSWKQDWLQHAQDLGVEASAYLEKRSTPEDILNCVREVMTPLARLERRLSDAGPVRGRLEGHSPYRLLRLSCATHPHSRLTVRCNPHAYEVQIREGAPRTAIRASGNGAVLHGATALGSLLSERSGRFTLSPEHAPVDAELSGTLHQQLSAHVALSRRASVPRVGERPPVAVPGDALQPAVVVVAPAAPLPPPPPPPQALTVAAPGPRAVWPGPQPLPRTLPLHPRAVARIDATTPLQHAAPRRKLPSLSIPLKRSWGARPLRWVGVAAIAALGIVLGAGVRALRQGSDAASTTPRAAAAQPR